MGILLKKISVIFRNLENNFGLRIRSHLENYFGKNQISLILCKPIIFIYGCLQSAINILENVKHKKQQSTFSISRRKINILPLIDDDENQYSDTNNVFRASTYNTRNLIKDFFFLISLFIFIFVLYLWLTYDVMTGYSYELYSLKVFGVYWYCGLDGISLVFIFLTSLIIPLCMLFARSKDNTNWISNDYIICLFSIEVLLLGVFLVSDLFLFFVFFEAILIPFFIMIGLFGTRTRKIHASYLLFFYTLVGSILMLVSIFYIYLHLGSTAYQILWTSEFSGLTSKLLWFSFFISFAIKTPILPFHIWLPEAHVEAPTEVSVILAAIMLKVGGYGFLRILIPSFPKETLYFAPLAIALCVLSILYTSLTTLRQIDLKRIIAYSSVAHMNVVVLGIFTLDPIGIAGSLLLMVGHGIVSGGLFFLIGMLYDRYKTKLVIYYGGLVHTMPIYTILLFFFLLGNIGLPLTCNFVGEFLVLYSVLKTLSFFPLIGVAFSIFFGTAYSMILFNKISFGLPLAAETSKNQLDLSLLEFCVLLPLVFFLFCIGIYPKIFLDVFSIDIINNFLILL